MKKRNDKMVFYLVTDKKEFLSDHPTFSPNVAEDFASRLLMLPKYKKATLYVMEYELDLKKSNHRIFTKLSRERRNVEK